MDHLRAREAPRESASTLEQVAIRLEDADLKPRKASG